MHTQQNTPRIICRADAQNTVLVSMLGTDAAGDALIASWKSLCLPSSCILRSAEMQTPTVVMCFDRGAVSCQSPHYNMHQFIVITKLQAHFAALIPGPSQFNLAFQEQTG